MNFACWVKKGHRLTLRINNTYCFSTARVAKRTCLSFAGICYKQKRPLVRLYVGVATTQLGASRTVCLRGIIHVVHRDTRLTVNGVVKGFIKKGD